MNEWTAYIVLTIIFLIASGWYFQASAPLKELLIPELKQMKENHQKKKKA